MMNSQIKLSDKIRRKRKRQKIVIAVILLFISSVVLNIIFIISNSRNDNTQTTINTPNEQKKNESSIGNNESSIENNDNLENSTQTDNLSVPKPSLEDQWMIQLVNEENSLNENSAPQATEKLLNGLLVDVRMASQLNKMMKDMRAEGLNPVICSAYRNFKKQKSLFDISVSENIRSGYSFEEAEKETLKEIARPGTSEHQTGLAVDIVSKDYQLLNDQQTTTPEVLWLNENCSEYGFILRYPKGKEEITKISHESWHFRYVGTTIAKYIVENGLCLEEYCALLDQ